MRDLDQSLGAFANGFAVQVGYAEFGHHVTHQATRGHHAGARTQHGHDARDRSVFCGGGDRDDRLAALGAGGAAQEVNLSADAAVELVPDGIGADLAGEVDLQGGVDSDHAVIAGDQDGIVDVGGGVEFKDRVVVDEIENTLGAKNESDDDFARLEVLALASDDAGFDQRDDSVGDQFAMNGEILAVGEQGKNGVGDAADAGLEHGAVFDQAGHVAGDGGVHFGNFHLFHLAQRPGGLDHNVDFAHVDDAVAISTRHLIVDLCDHVASLMGGGEGCVQPDSKTAEPVRVGRRDLDQCDVEWHGAADEEFFNFAQVDRRVVGTAVVDGVAHVGADEDGVVAEMSSHFGGNVRRRPHGHHVDDLDILDVRTALHERFDQSLRFGAPGLDVNPHAGLDTAQRFFGRAQFFLVLNFPRHSFLFLPNLALMICLAGEFREPQAPVRIRRMRSKSRDRKIDRATASFRVLRKPRPGAP